MTSSEPATHSRRIVLSGLAVAAVAGTSACSVRRERDAPKLPGIEPQGPPADQAALLQALAGARTLAMTAASSAPPWGPKLAVMHRAQVARLTGVIATDGITAPRAPLQTDDASMVGLGQLESAQLSPSAWAGAASAIPHNAAMLTALLAASGAAGLTLGVAYPDPGRTPTAKICAELLAPVRLAVYALEVIVARTPLKDRSLPAASVLAMSATRSRLEQGAGGAAPPAAQSYRLQTRPDSAAQRSLLARQVLSDVVHAAARNVPGTRGSVPSLKGVSREWAEALSLSWRWGVTPVAFPGLAG